MSGAKSTVAPVVTLARATYGLPPEFIVSLAEALAALEATQPDSDALLLAARRGASNWTRDLLILLQDLELSAPLAVLEAADEDEWWRVETNLIEARQQLSVLSSLSNPEALARSAAATASQAYARHRRAISEALGVAVPAVALVIVDYSAPEGEELFGWIPPYREAPWAISLAAFAAEGNCLDPTLLHELVHLTQPPFLTAVSDDKELEWVMAVGNRTLVEGATETLVRAIVLDGARDIRAVEVHTFAQLADYIGRAPREFAATVSASSYPLEFVAELLDKDVEQLAWDILMANAEEIDHRKSPS